MADYDLPDDLVEAKRAFYAAERRCQELVDAEPAPTAIVAMEADLSDEQRQALETARAERMEIVLTLHRHPFWATVAAEDMAAVQAHLRKAAKETDDVGATSS